MAALDAMKDTYCVIPIPAYEREGGLMYPSYYKHQLVLELLLSFTSH